MYKKSKQISEARNQQNYAAVWGWRVCGGGGRVGGRGVVERRTSYNMQSCSVTSLSSEKTWLLFFFFFLLIISGCSVPPWIPPFPSAFSFSLHYDFFFTYLINSAFFANSLTLFSSPATHLLRRRRNDTWRR